MASSLGELGGRLCGELADALEAGDCAGGEGTFWMVTLLVSRSPLVTPPLDVLLWLVVAAVGLSMLTGVGGGAGRTLPEDPGGGGVRVKECTSGGDSSGEVVCGGSRPGGTAEAGVGGCTPEAGRIGRVTSGLLGRARWPFGCAADGSR